MRELARERLQTPDRGAVIRELSRCTQRALDGSAVAFGEVIEDVALSLMSFVLSRFVLVVGLFLWPVSVFGRCSVLFRRLAAHTVSVGAVPAAQFLVGRQAARTQLEFAGTGVAAPRGREGLKGCWSASTCQLAISTLRATAALAGLPLPPQRSLTSR